MALSNASCLASPVSINNAILAAITECQDAANTTFCYPPNGTRICVPADDVSFFWPPNFYPPRSEIVLNYLVDPAWIFFKPNTGNITQDFTPLMYNDIAYPIPDVENERGLKMFLDVRSVDYARAEDVTRYDGPTVVLVKTAEFTSRVRSRTSSAAATGSAKGGGGGGGGLKTEEIVGVVIGVFFAVVIIACVWEYLVRRARGQFRTGVSPPVREYYGAASGASRPRESTGSRQAEQQSRPGSGVVARDEDHAEEQRSPGQPEVIEERVDQLPPYEAVERQKKPPAYVP